MMYNGQLDNREIHADLNFHLPERSLHLGAALEMIVANHVLGTVEKSLIKTPPADSRYEDLLPRLLDASAFRRIWRPEHSICKKKPIRRMIIARSSNQVCLGTNRSTPCHIETFSLGQVVNYGKGIPVVGKLISTTFETQLFQCSRSSRFPW